MLSQEDKKAENSSQESTDEDTRGKKDRFVFPWHIT